MKIMQEEIADNDDENKFREAALMVLPLIAAGVGHCLSLENPKVGFAQIKYAFNLESRKLRDVAAELGCTVQCLSSGLRDFVETNDLPLPEIMRSRDASKDRSKLRETQLTSNED